MLYNSVNAWLTSPDDYQDGLALLRETGYTGFSLTILLMGDDAYNRTRLEHELRKWLDGQKNVLPIVDDIASTPKLNTVQPDDQPIISLPRKPKPEPKVAETDAVQAIRFRTYGLLDQRAEAKAALRAMESLGNGDDACAQRLPYALSVKESTRQLDELYSQLDFFDQYGYLPPLATDPALVLDDRTTLLNARSYVSRYKAKLKKKGLTPEQRQTYTDLLHQYSEEKQRLERKLNPTPNDPDSTRQQTTHCPDNPPTLPGA